MIPCLPSIADASMLSVAVSTILSNTGMQFSINRDTLMGILYFLFTDLCNLYLFRRNGGSRKSSATPNAPGYVKISVWWCTFMRLAMYRHPPIHSNRDRNDWETLFGMIMMICRAILLLSWEIIYYVPTCVHLGVTRLMCHSCPDAWSHTWIHAA